jgi:predicted metal-dependent phosphoesterase TrpH
MSGVDLHIHTNASDGRFSPEEIVRKSVELGLSIISITDHDTVDGVIPALETAKDFHELKVIPGVEISTDVSTGEVHVLGYFIDYENDELLGKLMKMRNSRLDRARKMVEKLRSLGVVIEWERVREIAGDSSIGRPHIAQAMFEKGYIKSFKEAFNRYIGWGGPAYVSREKLTPAEAVELILKADGLPVLAHPLTIDEPEKVIVELIKYGLIGIEAFYHDSNTEDITRMVKVAEKHNLVTTGGTDYHGLDNSTETMLGGVDVPMESVEKLMALKK